MLFPAHSQRYPVISALPRSRRFMAKAKLCSIVLCLASAAHASAGSQAAANATCFRPAAGSEASNPPELGSHSGVLELTLKFKFRQTLIGEGPVRYCYMTADGEVAPTLRVRPGD